MHFSLDAEILKCQQNLDKLNIDKKYGLKNAIAANHQLKI